ncbi:hypothetical protein ARMGADRAFT_1020451, partial [Armillaria gallica]
LILLIFFRISSTHSFLNIHKNSFIPFNAGSNFLLRSPSSIMSHVKGLDNTHIIVSHGLPVITVSEMVSPLTANAPDLKVC